MRRQRKALKRAKVLEERRAAKRQSATPFNELEESATNVEATAESLIIAAEAVLTETRETIEALTVSARQQAHEISHRPETTAESFFQAHKEMTVTSKEQTRQKQLDFLQSMKVIEEVYEDELPAGTHVMSGRWVDTMKTPTIWRSKYTARGYEEPHNDEGCCAATATIQGIRMPIDKVTRHTKLLWRTTHKPFSTQKSVKANSYTHNHLKAGTRRF